MIKHPVDYLRFYLNHQEHIIYNMLLESYITDT